MSGLTLNYNALHWTLYGVSSKSVRNSPALATSSTEYPLSSANFLDTQLDYPLFQITVLCCTALLCTVLYCSVLHCTALHCTVLYCTVLYCILLWCSVLYLRNLKMQLYADRFFFCMTTCSSVNSVLDTRPARVYWRKEKVHKPVLLIMIDLSYVIVIAHQLVEGFFLNLGNLIKCTVSWNEF